MSYEDFPWFKDQTVKSIVNVEEQSPRHFYWPELDVDLSEQIIERPERFPLAAKAHNQENPADAKKRRRG